MHAFFKEFGKHVCTILFPCQIFSTSKSQQEFSVRKKLSNNSFSCTKGPLTFTLTWKWKFLFILAATKCFLKNYLKAMAHATSLSLSINEKYVWNIRWFSQESLYRCTWPHPRRARIRCGFTMIPAVRSGSTQTSNVFMQLLTRPCTGKNVSFSHTCCITYPLK